MYEQKYKSTKVQKYNRTKGQKDKSTTVQQYNSKNYNQGCQGCHTPGLNKRTTQVRDTNMVF